MKKIGLFGGSFDPVHTGHIQIARIAMEQLHLDELQFIPTGHNPWKNDEEASSIDRVKMLELAVKNENKMVINDIELQMNSLKNYTIDTLKLLKKQHPNYQYYYIMGMDQATLFHQWKSAQKISELVQLVAFQRGGYTPNHNNFQKYHFIVLDNDPLTISSTDVKNGHIEMLDKEVLSYITNKGIYLETLIKPRMKEKRWKHTCSVAKLAKEIAEANHLSGKEAYIAGIFHDIAKEMDYEQSLKIMQKYFPKFVDKPVPIWHQWVSRYVTEHEYLIHNETILKAIEHHTTADVHISSVGKCVYVADKLDPLRGYDSSQQIQHCMENIHEGFKESLIDFYQFSKKENREIDNCFFEIYKHFVEKGEI